MNYISNLPRDLSLMIFFNHLDETTRLNCLKVSKQINIYITSIVMKKLHLPFDENLSSHKQLMKHYKDYTNFFCKKLPTSFIFKFTWTAITEAKQKIDTTLALPDNPTETFFKRSMLDEAWSRFLHQIDPVQEVFRSISLAPEFDDRYDVTLSSDPNKDVQMFLRAGARSARLHPDAFGSIIKQDWCSLQTVQMLLDSNFEITLETILAAIKSNRFHQILPTMLKTVEPGTLSIYHLCKNVSSSYESMIEELYLDKEFDVGCYGIRGALEGDYSEKFVSKLLSKCTEDVDPYLIRLALEKKHSENLILDLLKKCSGGTDEYHIRLATSNLGSNFLIEKLLDKYNPEYECHKISQYTIRDTIQKYPENIISILMEKCIKEDLLESLHHIIKNSSYHKLLEKYLPETKGIFNEEIFRYLTQNGYSENVFLKIFGRSNQIEAIKEISLSDVIKLYSTNIAELLIDKGIDVYPDTHIGLALAKNYPEKIMSKIIDRADYIELADYKTAEQMSYSTELLKKMKAKCPDARSCIVM